MKTACYEMLTSQIHFVASSYFYTLILYAYLPITSEHCCLIQLVLLGDTTHKIKTWQWRQFIHLVCFRFITEKNENILHGARMYICIYTTKTSNCAWSYIQVFQQHYTLYCNHRGVRHTLKNGWQHCQASEHCKAAEEHGNQGMPGIETWKKDISGFCFCLSLIFTPAALCWWAKK